MRPSRALQANAEQVAAILARFDVTNARIFGSVARGEDDEASDLDILVEPGDDATLFDLARLEREISTVLGCKVDVTTPGGLSADAAESARRAGVSVRRPRPVEAWLRDLGLRRTAGPSRGRRDGSVRSMRGSAPMPQINSAIRPQPVTRSPLKG